MTVVIVWFGILYLLMLPVRSALRRRRVAPPAPPVVVVVVQQPAAPPLLTLAQEAEQYLQGQDGSR
jgi:hypothetical protein